MALQEFFENPTEERLDKMSKEELFEVAAHFDIGITAKEKHLKEGVGLIVKSALADLGVFTTRAEKPAVSGVQDPVELISPRSSPSLTYEQQRDVLLLEMENNKINQEVELSKQDIEAQRLQLIREGRLESQPNVVPSQVSSLSVQGFDVARK